MKFVFLGTTGYHPNNRRQTLSVMFPDNGFILDAGTGLFRAREFVSTDQLHVFLSHVHLDHCIGLTFLFDVVNGKQMRQTQVYVEGEKQTVLEEHLFHPLLFPAMPPIDFIPMKIGPNAIKVPDQMDVHTFPLSHPGGSVGCIVQQNGKRIAYVTDTTAGLDEPYLEQIAGVDLLIHECYFPDGFEEQAAITGHSCATSVAQVARQCGVGELLLVHVNPLDETDDPIGLESLREIFSNVRIAEDLMEVEI